MMEPPPALSGLEHLPSQGDGIDMRPTLLRVLTDLYLQRPTHTAEDERYYTELALRLIDATDVSQRAALAARLARYPSAPRLVVERLARDTIEVAGPVLAHSPCLTPDALETIAQVCGGVHAEIIARRTADWPTTTTPSRVGSTAAEASELSELFYAAGPTERRLILVNLDYAMLTPSQPLATIQQTDVWRLESAVLRHNTEAAVCELERTLGISPAQARRIFNDESGEPIVVAAKAMNFPGDVLPRMLLFMNSRFGQSVDRVYELAELFSQISVDAARRMIAIWRAAAPDDNHQVPQRTMAWRTAAENARRALAEVSRRPDPRMRGSMRREPFRKRHDRENGAPNDLPPR
jgi:hypothetical protein